MIIVQCSLSGYLPKILQHYQQTLTLVLDLLFLFILCHGMNVLNIGFSTCGPTVLL